MFDLSGQFNQSRQDYGDYESRDSFASDFYGSEDSKQAREHKDAMADEGVADWTLERE